MLRFKDIRSTVPLKSVSTNRNYHWFVVGTVCVGAFMAALDSSIINIALPTLQKNFQVHMHIIEWVSLVYLLTLTSLVVPFGRMADMVGRRWMYTSGFAIFIIGSAVCGLSSTLTELLVFRGVQAVGAAMLQANSVSIVTAATPPRQRGRAIGIQASAQGVGLALGPAVGGALLSVLSWHWIFLINVPVGLVGTALGIFVLPADNIAIDRERFDFAGAALLVPSLVALIFVLNMGLKLGFASPRLLAGYIVLVVCLTIFIWVERRVHAPMLDLGLFRNTVFVLGNINGVLSFSMMYAVLLLTPFYLDGVLRLGPLMSGLLLSIVPVGMTLVTPFSGTLSDKRGRRLPTVLGMALGLIGLTLLAAMTSASWSYALLAPGLFLIGAGVGLFTPPNNSSIMGSVPNNRLGVTGGVVNMARSLGMGLGITLGGLSYQLLLVIQGFPNEHTATIPSMVTAFHGAFAVVGVVALVALLLSSAKKVTQPTSSR